MWPRPRASMTRARSRATSSGATALRPGNSRAQPPPGAQFSPIREWRGRRRPCAMARYFCHDQPETRTLETQVLDARPGKAVLADSPFYPGGGGQPPDRGILRWQSGEAAVTGFEYADGKLWHLLAGSVEPSGRVEAVVDPAFRGTMRQLHTDSHILNALIYQAFDGALVTGVQMYEDGTARMDFDLPGADNDRIRALEAPINEIIARDVAVTF